MNVFADNITIEDDMSVLVKYASGATMTYHLTAYSVSDPLGSSMTSTLYPDSILSDTLLVTRLPCLGTTITVVLTPAMGRLQGHVQR
jgi:hypothetical protein